MHPVFESQSWSVSLPPPWRATDKGAFVELTQQEGIGILCVGRARKATGSLLDHELATLLVSDCPSGVVLQDALCGDFSGYRAQFIAADTGRFWRKWCVSSGATLLFISYECAVGEDQWEAFGLSMVLASLKARD